MAGYWNLWFWQSSVIFRHKKSCLAPWGLQHLQSTKSYKTQLRLEVYSLFTEKPQPILINSWPLSAAGFSFFPTKELFEALGCASSVILFSFFPGKIWLCLRFFLTLFSPIKMPRIRNEIAKITLFFAVCWRHALTAYASFPDFLTQSISRCQLDFLIPWSFPQPSFRRSNGKSVRNHRAA